MAFRRSGVRIPVAPPTAAPTTHDPSRIGGGSRVSGTAERDRHRRDPTRATDRIERYDPTEIEPRWQARWDELGLYDTDLDDASRPPSYILTMYPYPSGDLHIGHWYIVTPTDALARFHRMHGENVFFPIGFDAFGLPAENAAIKNNINPRDWTMQNIEHERRQFRSMGAVFDWRYEIVTCEPEFYRWNQWLFLRFLEAGLAYRRMSPVDWCPNDGTLAREQVEGADRHCWRCGAPVEKRDLEQWYLRTTKYADELLDFSGIDWPEPIRLQQTNWIGRSEGGGDRLHDGTRRSPARAATSCACSRPGPTRCSGRRSWCSHPEHTLVAKLTAPERRAEVEAYIARAQAETEIERLSTDREKTGVYLGADAINPVNGERIPIWIADYVLSGYGTGAIMAVPAHDERDFAFARRFGLPIRRVIAPAGSADDADARRRVRRPHARRTARQLGPVQRHGRARRDAGDRRLAGRGRPGQGRPSRTACATGCSAGSATGARRSRSSTASGTASCPSPTRTCRCGYRTRSTTVAGARTR